MLTTKLIARLQLWKAAGDRLVSIELPRSATGPTTIWIYDYSIQGGIFLDEANVDQNWDKLILQETKSRLSSQLEDVSIRLEAM